MQTKRKGLVDVACSTPPSEARLARAASERSASAWVARRAAALAAVFSTACAGATTVLPLQEFDLIAPQWQATLPVAGGQLTQTLSSFGVASGPATMRDVSLSGNNGDPYDFANGRSVYFTLAMAQVAPFMARPQALIGELLAGGTAPGVTLRIGKDSNGDGKPQSAEELCTATYVATSISCVSALSTSSNAKFWVMASAPSTNGQYRAHLSAGVPGIYLFELGGSYHTYTNLTVPATVAPGHAFEVGVQVAPLTSLQRYYGAVLMSSTDALGSWSILGNVDAMIPFAMEEASAAPIVIDPTSGPVRDPASSALVTGVGIPSGQTARRLFFDLPASASTYDSITVTASDISGNVPDVDLQLVRADFPAESTSAIVAPAPIDGTVAATWTIAAPNAASSVSLDHPQAGRWYVVASNGGAAESTLVIDVAGAPGGANAFGASTIPSIAPGQYFNPLRAGHGISISRASGQQLMFWYTYLDDGTPTWYLAQAASGNSGWWTSTLYRVTWDGSRGTPSAVGTVELAPIAANRFLYTWLIGDRSGSETFDLLAPGNSCVAVTGAPASFSGNWFAPQQAGYGVDVLALPQQQFDLMYFYDAGGTARWGIGSVAPFSTNSGIDLLQSTAFCATCAWTPATTRPLGELKMIYNSPSSGNLKADLTLQDPLSGSWHVDQPSLRLTGSVDCTP